jgi:predicted amidohydrolase
MTNKNSITIAGCRIPVTPNIPYNLEEIKKAIDWCANNSVDILVTPECSLSGYMWAPGFPNYDNDPKMIELSTATDQLIEYAGEKKIDLVLGTAGYDENGQWINMQKYILGGKWACDYSKNQLTELETIYTARNFFPPVIDYKGHKISGLICNDYWANAIKTPNHGELLLFLKHSGVEVIFLSAFVFKWPGNDMAYYKWSEGHVLMNSMIGDFATVVSDSTTNVDGTEYQGEPCSPVGIANKDGKWVARGDDAEVSYFKFVLTKV